MENLIHIYFLSHSQCCLTLTAILALVTFNQENPIHKSDPNLFIQKIKKLFLGLFNIVLRSTDEDLVTVTAFWWEFNADSTALIHDGANETTLGTNHGIVMLMWDVNFYLGDICLQKELTFETGLKLGINSIVFDSTNQLVYEWSLFCLVHHRLVCSDGRVPVCSAEGQGFEP